MNSFVLAKHSTAEPVVGFAWSADPTRPHTFAMLLASGKVQVLSLLSSAPLCTTVPIEPRCDEGVSSGPLVLFVILEVHEMKQCPGRGSMAVSSVERARHQLPF